MFEGKYYEDVEAGEEVVEQKIGTNDPFMNKVMFINRDTTDLK